ncbi:hypothetical protein CsSME_00023985 [Camellia sinensis var. sinensis]
MQEEARTDSCRDNIVQSDWSDEVLPSSDPYMLWYRQYTRLLVGNPSHLSESGYQGVGPSLKALVVRAGRSYHLAEDPLFRHNGQHALQAIAEIRDLLYEAIQHAHRGDRLHFGHYGVHSAAAAPDTSVSFTSVPSTLALATSGPWTSVTPPHATIYISPDSLHVHPTQHTGIPYVADPDWTPLRYMHEFSLTSYTFRMRSILRPAPEREGEVEVMVVADVAGEVGVRAEAEVEVQLQIVIQLHQMTEFHSSQQYPMLGQREDQGQHRLARDMKLSILKSDAKKNGIAPNVAAIKAIKDDHALLSDPELSDCSDSEIAD